MVTLSNSPKSETLLRLEARKSFSLALVVTDAHSRPLDVSTATLRLVIKRKLAATGMDDAENLIVDETAVPVDAVNGRVRFDLQAADLNVKPADYPYVAVLENEGYSTVLFRGTVEVLENAEYSSVASAYNSSGTSQALSVALRNNTVVQIVAGAGLAPGVSTFTDADKAKLDAIEAGAQLNAPGDWLALPDMPGWIRNKPAFGTAALANLEDVAVPRDGNPGEMLMKTGPQPTDFAWAVPPVGPGPGNLTAVGVTKNAVPVANGAGSWSWDEIDYGVRRVNGQTGDILLKQENIPDSAMYVRMTPLERQKLAELQTGADWSQITNKPVLGTASTRDDSYFLRPGNVSGQDITSGLITNARLPRLSEMRGHSRGTSAPTGGVDGDTYFQYSV